MNAKLFSNCEYATILMDWWFKHHGKEFNANFISQHGIVVLKDSTPQCVCFLYFPSNSKLCQLAFVVRNPWIEPYRAGKAMKLLLNSAVHVCRQLGYNAIYSASENLTVQRLLGEADFFQCENKSIEFSKEL